jgi:hypothetical protein
MPEPAAVAHVFERAQHDDRTRDQMEAAFGGMLG